MRISVTALAGATIANQPTYDQGGIAIKVLDVICGNVKKWETLCDKVTLSVEGGDGIGITNIVNEEDVSELPTKPEMHTAGKVIIACVEKLREAGFSWSYKILIKVEKGISIKGTGLGSSGASSAAAMKAFELLLEKLDVDYIFKDRVKTRILTDADFGVPDNDIPAYFGGITLITNNDGELDVGRLQAHANFGYFVIATPRGFGIKTEDARKVLQGVSIPDDNDAQVKEMVEAFENGETEKYAELMEKAHSWFVKPRSRLYPKNGELYDLVYDAAKKAGALGVTIGGAGPTMLAVVNDIQTGGKVGRAMYNAFKYKGYDSVARLVGIDNTGAQVIATL